MCGVGGSEEDAAGLEDEEAGASVRRAGFAFFLVEDSARVPPSYKCLNRLSSTPGSDLGPSKRRPPRECGGCAPNWGATVIGQPAGAWGRCACPGRKTATPIIRQPTLYSLTEAKFKTTLFKLNNPFRNRGLRASNKTHREADTTTAPHMQNASDRRVPAGCKRNLSATARFVAPHNRSRISSSVPPKMSHP